VNGDGVVLQIVTQLDRVDGPAGIAPGNRILKVEPIEAQSLRKFELQMKFPLFLRFHLHAINRIERESKKLKKKNPIL
jgi:hypothetical protein